MFKGHTKMAKVERKRWKDMDRTCFCNQITVIWGTAGKRFGKTTENSHGEDKRINA